MTRKESTPSVPGTVTAPVFRDLTRSECEEVLRRNSVGRLAFSFHDRVSLEPLHYVYDAGWLYGRTSQGSKVALVKHNHWVAFEVDEAPETFDWRSVVVHGALYFLAEDGTATERAARARALELLARIVPGTGTWDDPVPERTVVFRIHAEDVTGRASTPRTRPARRGRAP